MWGPYGPRRVTYADYTASGRALDFVERFVVEEVLPRYANTHTESSGTGLQTTALTMAPAAYVNAIRRMSALVAVVLGGALFREADIGRRLVAALLACAGAACLLLAH